MSDTFQIELPHFQGPFDLLLFFIERDELDIYDIPIARITADFLGYIRRLEVLNMEVASGFVVVAATLMRIKAKMLLPRKELDERGEEIDPRAELTEKLLEYKRLKEVLPGLSGMEWERLQREQRGGIQGDLAQVLEQAALEAEWESLDLYRLLQVFGRVMARYEGRREVVSHRIVRYEYSIEQQRVYILDRLSGGEVLGFEGVFGGLDNRLHAIFTFLALLELAQQQLVRVEAGEVTNDLQVCAVVASG